MCFDGDDVVEEDADGFVFDVFFSDSFPGDLQDSSDGGVVERFHFGEGGAGECPAFTTPKEEVHRYSHVD